MSASFIVGVLLIGSYVNLIFYTLELFLCHRYLWKSERAKKDATFLKLSVVFIACVDGVATFGACALVYMFTVPFWGNVAAVQKSYWPFILIVIGDGLSTFVVQGFMIYRYWTISSNLFVTVILIFIITEALAVVFIYGISAVVNKLNSRSAHFHYVVIALSSIFASTVAVTACLVWHIEHIKTQHKETKSLLRRVIRIAIVTGLLPAIIALVALVVYVSKVDLWQVSISLGLLLGRVYSCSLLYILLTREKSRGTSVIYTSDELPPSVSSGDSHHHEPMTPEPISPCDIQFKRDEDPDIIPREVVSLSGSSSRGIT